MDSKHNVVPAYRFLLRVEGVQDVPLKAIRPFVKENEYETIVEGGLNDYVHLRRKQVTKPFQLVAERYVSQDFYDPLPNGMEFLLPLMLFVGQADAQDFDFMPVRTYVFTGCTLMNKEVSGFDAEKSGLLTETLTIAYSTSYTIDNPINTESVPWKFTKNNITNKYADLGIKVSANEMHLGSADDKESFLGIAADHLWRFGKTAEDYRGNGVQFAAKLPAAVTGEKGTSDSRSDTERFTEIAEKDHLWKFGKDKKDYAGKGSASARRLPEAGNGSATARFMEIAKKHHWQPVRSASTYPGSKSDNTSISEFLNE